MTISCTEGELQLAKLAVSDMANSHPREHNRCSSCSQAVPHPYTSALERIWGSMAGGTPNRRSVGSCQLRLRRSIRLVRLALLASVTCRPPPPAPPVG